MNMTIIEPIESFIKEFYTIDEFSAFYFLHKDEIHSIFIN